MPQPNDSQNTVPNLQDKRKPAPGVLPKNAQTWVVMGLTAVIMVMLWVSGPAIGTKSAQKSDTVMPASVVGLSPAEIGARLEQERREQQMPSVPAQRFLNRQSVPGDSGTMVGGQENAPPTEKDPIQQDIRRREYTSRFASSVSLSYRPSQASEASKTPVDPAPQSSLDLSVLGIPNLPSALTGTALNAVSSTAPLAPTLPKKMTPNFNQTDGKDYVIFEGTFLETVLVTRLSGDFSGPVLCMLTSDVYSHNGQRVLIPAGTKVLGETKRVEGFGQTRLAVVFHRLVMPDGYSVDLDQFHGLNQIGETGLKDRVNHHYLQIFGASIAVGAIAGLAEVGSNTSSLGLALTPSDAYKEDVATSLAQSSTHILDKFLNLLPTITIREGHRVRVYLTQDLLVPDYAQHEMPSNL
jgi:type IV secretion system protein TrbI